jgi:hypothetical protein
MDLPRPPLATDRVGGGVGCDVFVVATTGHALTASASGNWLVAGEGGQTGGQDQPDKQAGR